MWESAYEMFKDHPVFGVGIGQYASKNGNEYKSPEAKEKQNHCHNNFLQMLAENGVAGFIGFCLLFGYILLSSLKNAFFKCSPYYVLIFGSSLALLLQGFTEYNFGNSAVIKYYWATLGCADCRCLCRECGCNLRTTRLKIKPPLIRFLSFNTLKPRYENRDCL